MKPSTTNDNNGGRTPIEGGQLRDYDELEGTLLPTASMVEPSFSSSAASMFQQENIPTARPILQQQQQQHDQGVSASATSVFEDEGMEAALLIPPVPTDDNYRNNNNGQNNKNDDDVLVRAQRTGKLASEKERMNVIRENHNKVHAYNNQAELDVDRANEVARIENYREHQLVGPTISTPTATAAAAAAATNSTTTTTKDHSKKERDENYFPTRVKGGGYKVKEYDIGEYDGGGYSYDIAEYKSDYD